MAPLNAGKKITIAAMVLILILLFAGFSTGKVVSKAASGKAVFDNAENLWKQKKWDDAVTAYETYLAENPDGEFADQAYMNLGQFMEGYGHFEDALALYQHGLNRAKGRTAEILQTEIASVHNKMGNLDKAIKIYQDIMQNTQAWDLYKAANRNLKGIVKLRSGLKLSEKKGNDCGEESLRAVLKFFGSSANEIAFKEDLKSDSKGISLDSLNQEALKQSLNSYGIKAEDKRLENLPFPAILHFHPGHYVVFQGITQKGADIFDPSNPMEQHRIVPLSKIKSMWSGYALCFDQNADRGKSISFLTKEEMQSVYGGHNWWHSGILSWFGGPEDNPHTPFFDPPNILVNTATMNVVVEQIDGVWKGMAQNIILKRTYNADDSESGMFGNSWHFQYEIFLEENLMTA